MKLRTNVQRLTLNRQMRDSAKKVQNSTSKLASGSRITRAGDDAAGAAISKNMEGKIASRDVATRNANDGISMVQIAEGALGEIKNSIIRMRELMIQSASDTVSSTERDSIDREITSAKVEIDRIAQSTTWNGNDLLTGKEKSFDVHVDTGTGHINKIKFDITDMAQTVWSLGIADISAETQRHAQHSLVKLDYAMRAVSESSAKLGALSSRFGSTINKLINDQINEKKAKSQIKDADVADESSQLLAEKLRQSAQQSVNATMKVSRGAALKLI